MTSERFSEILAELRRLSAAVEALAPPSAADSDFSAADCFVWDPSRARLDPVTQPNRIDIGLICGIDRVRDILLGNTRRFAAGLPANNALVWGARGMGKSSLVKAVHAAVAEERRESAPALKLVELHREDVASLPQLAALLRGRAERFVLFCDDLSFEEDMASYKSLKAALEGGIEGHAANAVFYATSNRRHLMPRRAIENERAAAIVPSEAADEKVSLSDRFGLWLGVHPCSQDGYLEMVAVYARRHGLAVDAKTLRAEALEWAATRGARSGRVAWQFIRDLAGRLGQRLDGGGEREERQRR